MTSSFATHLAIARAAAPAGMGRGMRALAVVGKTLAQGAVALPPRSPGPGLS